MSRRALLVVLLTIAGASFVAGTAAAQANVRGVWMAGPGCGGRFEWFQHPDGFPYFCDGNAVVEQVHWSNWGAPKATASATFNEAAVNSHDNVATAPRRRSPVTITASQIKACGSRHAYTRIIITFDEAMNGVKKLKASGLLPECSRPGKSSVR
jgi:hypothetical protein